MKKKQRKQKKVSMTSPSLTAVTTPSESFPPRTVGVPETHIGHILELFRERIANPPTTHLEDNLDPPHSHVAKIVRTLAPSNEISEECKDYLAFCKRAGIASLPFRVVQSHDERGYKHYSVYCVKIGVEREHLTLEHWLLVRDAGWIWSDEDGEFHFIHRKPFHHLLYEGKADSFLLETFLSGDRKLSHNSRPHHFSVMMNVGVGVRDTSSCDPIKSFTEKPVHRVVTVVEAEASYYSPSQQLLELRFLPSFSSKSQPITLAIEHQQFEQGGVILYPVTPRCEQEPACVTRPLDRPITFDTHLARASYRPALQRVNKRDMTPFEYSKQLNPQSIVNRKVKNPEKTVSREWCKTCLEYVLQTHQCPPAMVTCSAGPGGFYPIEQKARQLLLADKQRRDREYLQRIWFPQSRTTAAHKAAWVKSVGEQLVSAASINVVVCDPEVLKQPLTSLFSFPDQRSAYLRKSLRRLDTSIVVDYLPVPRCTHPNLRSFTFNTGETIQMCRDCTKFDKEREALLRTRNVPTTTQELNASWNARLDEEGLSEHRATIPNQVPLNEANPMSSTGRVKTAGWSGTAHDGSRGNSCSRDGRGERWFEDQQDKEPKTKSKCLKCGADIYAKAGTNFCPDTDCAQRFQEAWDGGLKTELFEAAQREPVLMDLFEHINRNRS